MTDYSALPVCEFAFPGPLRDQLVAAVLDGSKTSTTATLIEYAIEQEDLPVAGWPKWICSMPSTRARASLPSPSGGPVTRSSGIRRTCAMR